MMSALIGDVWMRKLFCVFLEKTEIMMLSRGWGRSQCRIGTLHQEIFRLGGATTSLLAEASSTC